MHLSYEKLGTDDPMYGKAEYIVMDEMQPICYKTAEGYLPIVTETAMPKEEKVEAVKTQPLYVLSFKINDEAEEMVFKSKKKMDKTIELFKSKDYVTDMEIKTHQVVA